MKRSKKPCLSLVLPGVIVAVLTPAMGAAPPGDCRILIEVPAANAWGGGELVGMGPYFAGE